MKITPIENKVFGATVTGVALGDLTNAEFAAIEAAFLDYGFLAFPRQFLSEQENVAFGMRFGELEFGGSPMSNQERLSEGRFGKIFDIDTQRMRTNVGNEAWHTDSTYKPISSKCGMLSAVQVPEEGGETELADLRAGYAALDQATKHRIEGLSAYHSTQYSQANDVGDFPAPGCERHLPRRSVPPAVGQGASGDRRKEPVRRPSRVWHSRPRTQRRAND